MENLKTNKQNPPKSQALIQPQRIARSVQAKPVQILAKPGKQEKEVIIEQPKRSKEKKSFGKKYGKHASNWLKKFNPWLSALSDPFNIHGIQIPDMVTSRSGTFTVWDHRQITANSGGIASLAYGVNMAAGYPGTASGSLIPVGVSPSANNDFAVGMIGPSGATSSTLFGTSGTLPAPIALTSYGSSSSTVVTLFNQVRLVSFGVRIVFTGNFTNAQGTITIVSATRQWLRNNTAMQNGAITLALLQSHPEVQIISIPRDFGGTAIYKPLDNVSMQYTDVTETYALTDMPESAFGGEIYIAVTGAVSAQSFQVDACWNFEGVPRTNQLDLVSTSISKSDAVSLESTFNALPDMPSALPLSQVKESSKEVSVPDLTRHDEQIMTDRHPSQDKTMIEKIVDGVGTALDGGIKIAEKVSPFLAALL